MTVSAVVHPGAERPLPRAYQTDLGEMLVLEVEKWLRTTHASSMEGSIDLIFTSPPFPLVRQKSYGNRTGIEYLEWISGLAPQLARLLKPSGSLVVEIGNAWESGSPTMSTLPLETLLAIKASSGLELCQQVICHNPARLPSPAQWVNVERVRLKDSYTHVWWLSPTPHPKADNRRVLVPYSKHMKALLKRQKYNSGYRPSGHKVSESGFLVDRGGAIAPSVIESGDISRQVPESLLEFAGTSNDNQYRSYCKQHGLEVHPARMQTGLAAFFTAFLTEPGDMVLDPFAGSNTTGFVAERLGRRWLSIEAKRDYAHGSKGRFVTPSPV